MASNLRENKQLVPDITIKIDGKEEVTSDDPKKGKMSFRNGENILGFEVNKLLNTPDYFSVRLNMYEDASIVLLDKLFEGKEVEIIVGYQGEDHKTIMKGEVTYIEPNFDYEGQSYLELCGYDKSHRLTRGMTSYVWGDGIEAQQSYESIVSEIIKNSGDPDQQGSDGLTVSQKDSSPYKVKYHAIVNTNPYIYVQSLGHQLDLKSDSDDVKDQSKILFKKPDPGKSPILTVCRDKPEGTNPSLAIRAKFQMSTVHQYKKVVVRGWDPKTKKAIVGEATESDYKFGGKEGWKVTGKAFYGSESSGKVYEVCNQVVESKAEAEAVAKAIFNRLSMTFINAEFEIHGDPNVNPGEVVEVKGFGKRFDGKYLVVGCTHYFYPDSTGYRTIINAARNSIGDGKNL